MPYLIKHQNGTVMGLATNKPGAGNKLPDGTDEVHEFYEDDPKDAAYDAARTIEAAAFRAAQDTKVNAPRTTAQKLAALGITAEELKAELAK